MYMYEKNNRRILRAAMLSTIFHRSRLLEPPPPPHVPHIGTVFPFSFPHRVLSTKLVFLRSLFFPLFLPVLFVPLQCSPARCEQTRR